MIHDNHETAGVKQLMKDIIGWTMIPLREAFESFTTHKIGQVTLGIGDKCLWNVEKSLEWTLPVEKEDDPKEKTSGELIRPLPWILFLPMLLFLRIIKEIMSLGAFIIGKKRITTTDLLMVVQSSREVLHLVKVKGMKRGKGKESYETHSVLYENLIYCVEWLLTKMSSMVCFNAVKYSNSKETIAIKRKETKKNKDDGSSDDSEIEMCDADQPEDERMKMKNRNAQRKLNGSTDMRSQKRSAENFLDGEKGDNRDDDLNNSSNQYENEQTISHG